MLAVLLDGQEPKIDEMSPIEERQMFVQLHKGLAMVVAGYEQISKARGSWNPEELHRSQCAVRELETVETILLKPG